MPPPVNTTAATATDITSLPATIAQNVNDAGTTYTVWYSVTATTDDVMVGLFGFGGSVGSGYQPSTEVFTGPTGAPVSTGIFAQNKPVQFYVPAGQTRYIQFVSTTGNVGTANLSIAAEAASLTGVVGLRPMLVINDDTNGLPAALVDLETGDAVGFISGFPAGEAGDRLPTGETLVADANAGNLQLYDTNLENPVTVAFNIGFSPAIRANRTLNVFYAGTDGNPVVVKAISATGTITSTITLTGRNGLTGLAASNDGTIIYNGDDTTNQPIRRWVVGVGAGTDLAAAQGANIIGGQDIIVLNDDTILASIVNMLTGAFSVKRFTDGGTVLNTYSIATTSFLPVSTPPRIALGEDDTSFWAWFHRDGADEGTSRFVEIEVSSGTILTTVDTVEYETGVYQPAETATPLARFGHSFSCFFLFLPGAPVTVDLSEECCPCDCPTPLGRHGSAASAPLESHTGNILPPIDVTDWTPQCTGAGDVPSAADATDPESWVQ